MTMFVNFVNADKADRRAAGAKDIAPDLPTPQQVKVSNLAKECLTRKWFADSGHRVMDACPFCYDARENANTTIMACLSCKCPVEICSDAGDKGLVRELADKYDKDIRICDLDSEDLDRAIALFNKYIIVETSPKV
jgi:hypothetical protein